MHRHRLSESVDAEMESRFTGHADVLEFQDAGDRRVKSVVVRERIIRQYADLYRIFIRLVAAGLTGAADKQRCRKNSGYADGQSDIYSTIHDMPPAQIALAS